MDSVKGRTVQADASNWYCPAIHHQLYIERYDSDSAGVSPCCAVLPKTFPNDQVDFSNNIFLQDLRHRNITNQALPECKFCIDSEQSTGRSLRMSLVDHYKLEKVKVSGLAKLDWNVEPICNAKCIICSSYHSSSWLAEDIKHNETDIFPIRRTAKTARHNKLIDQIDFSNLKSIYFNGGEPVLSQDPVDILQKIDALGRLSEIEVGMSMNGSTLPNHDFQRLLNRAGSVAIFFSIDAIEQSFHYIRYPITWPTMQNTVQSMLDNGIKKITINSSVGIHNCLIMPELMSWWRDFIAPWRGKIHIYENQQLVKGPLSMSNVGPQLRDHVLDKLENFDQNEAWVQLSKHGLITANSTDQEWMHWLSIIDRRRSLNWRQYLPKLAKAAESCGL